MALGTGVRALGVLVGVLGCSPPTPEPPRADASRVAADRLEPVPIVAVHAWDSTHVAIVAEGGFFAYSSDGEAWAGASVPGLEVSELRGGIWPQLWARSASAVWHWAGPEHPWHPLDGLEDVQSLVALEGNEAVAAVRGAVVRFSDGARDRLATPGFEPERVAASSDGSTLVACGRVEPTSERTCRVGSTSLLAPWRGFQLVEPARAPIEPWVSGDGELAAFAIPGSRVVRTAVAWLPGSLAPMNVWFEASSCPWSKTPVGGMPTLLCHRKERTSRFRLSRNGFLSGAPTPLRDFADDRPGGGWAVFRSELVHYAHEGADDSAALVRSGADRRAHVLRAKGEPFVHASNDPAGRDAGVWRGKAFHWSEEVGLWEELRLEGHAEPTAAHCSRRSEQCWIGGQNLDIWRREADEPDARKTVDSAGRGAITAILELDGVLLALGEGGAFLVSRDRGTTWKRRVVDARLRSATMDDAGALWLGGSQGALFRWRDGQAQPEAVKSGTTDTILALAADGAGHVLFATDQRAVSRRAIGGASWSRVLEPREPTTEAAFERRANGNAVVWFANPDERYELVPVEP
jgi:hypothetical protein